LVIDTCVVNNGFWKRVFSIQELGEVCSEDTWNFWFPMISRKDPQRYKEEEKASCEKSMKGDKKCSFQDPRECGWSEFKGDTSKVLSLKCKIFNVSKHGNASEKPSSDHYRRLMEILVSSEC